MEKKHESYGMVSISRFSSSNIGFFGSDLKHSGGVTITISKADTERNYHGDSYYSGAELIKVRLSANQYVDAITSGMNTQGVPCTIERLSGESVPEIDYITDRKEQFKSEMSTTQLEYISKIDNLISQLDSPIGKKKSVEIKHDLNVLKRHIVSNTNFVLTCFNKAMEKTVSEAKHTVANYIDHKVHTLGIESIKDQLKISIEDGNTEQD